MLTASLGAAPAYAADFPSWTDVQAAKRDEASAKAELARLTAAISTAQVEVDSTQKEAEARGNEFNAAQQAYDEQVLVAQKVEEQRAAAQAVADKAKADSTRLISKLAKQGGGGDLTVNLLGDTGGADSYLYRIGAMQKVSERSDALWANAVQAQNVAKSLAAQEEVEKNKLEQLRQDAEAKQKVAQAAAEAAAQRLADLEAAQAKAASLTAFLTGQREQTEADYLEGLRQKWGSGAGGEVSPSGWARPAAGYISSNFGQRYHPIYHRWQLHTGVDLAGPGCGIPIYAAHAGVVTYAGWNGDLGNFIQIDHRDGTSSGYGHIMPGGIGVSIGQEVAPGQPIARVGTTGGSTGCHLHFIIRVNGQLTDPVPFMRNQGITLG
ncbi:M23 family metallopeptidase [Protaetiibacter larvae]|uniref:M23 family metallopeptidase n=1 Tax=Protaetiibacter larvae TaxID=2592654 RepID=A0A5C1Y896_9MICO|nr:M23 family metallopeptidase [Protaetiibacter larvae]